MGDLAFRLSFHTGSHVQITNHDCLPKHILSVLPIKKSRPREFEWNLHTGSRV